LTQTRSVDSSNKTEESTVHREEWWDAANSANLEKKKWADLKVGDVVLLMPGEEAPADCVILSSTSELGVNYIETSQLDGED
jgi:P-type E1-E2 ATPase